MTAAIMNEISDDLNFLLPGTVLAYGTKASAVSTSGTTFAAGADLLAAALSFTADGTSDYLVRVGCDAWTNTAIAACFLNLNLDGADAGFVQTWNCPTANFSAPVSGSTPILAPAAGSHTVNVRLRVSGGSGAVNGGAGGAGSHRPILVTVETL